MTAQRSNCNLFVLFGVSVVHYILLISSCLDTLLSFFFPCFFFGSFLSGE